MLKTAQAIILSRSAYKARTLRIYGWRHTRFLQENQACFISSIYIDEGDV